MSRFYENIKREVKDLGFLIINEEQEKAFEKAKRRR